MSIFGDIVAGTGAAVGGMIAAQGARKATNQAVKGINSGIAELDENRDYVAGLWNPYTTTGGNALAKIGALSGANGAQAQQDAFGQYVESPEVAFSRDQGIQAIDRSANSRGGLYSGRTMTDLNKFGQGVAMQGYGNYYDRLARLAGMGFDATGAVANNATGTARSIADLYVGKGATKAAGTIGKTNAYTGMTQGIADSVAALGEDAAGFMNPLAKLGMSSYGG
jgi:hypothetical protein